MIAARHPELLPAVQERCAAALDEILGRFQKYVDFADGRIDHAELLRLIAAEHAQDQAEAAAFWRDRCGLDDEGGAGRGGRVPGVRRTPRMGRSRAGRVAANLVRMRRPDRRTMRRRLMAARWSHARRLLADGFWAGDGWGLGMSLCVGAVVAAVYWAR